MTSDSGDVRASKALGRGARSVTGLLATLLLAGGCAGVFLTDNEIGTAVLLAAGTLFTSVSVLGHWPRLRVGDNEFDPAIYRVGRSEGVVDGARLVRKAVEKEAEKDSEQEPRERPQHDEPPSPRSEQRSTRDASPETKAAPRARGNAAQRSAARSFSGGLVRAALDAERLARAQNLVMTNFNGDESRLGDALELVAKMDELNY